MMLTRHVSTWNTGIALFISLGLVACSGGSKGPHVLQKDKGVSLSRVNALLERSQGFPAGTGEGEACTGRFVLETKAGEGQCSSNDGSQTTPALKGSFSCTQDDGHFTCGTKAEPDALKGYIHKDGQFGLYGTTLLGYTLPAVGTDAADRTEKHMLIVGKLDAACKKSGPTQLQFAEVYFVKDKQGHCHMGYDVEVFQKVSGVDDPDDTDDTENDPPQGEEGRGSTGSQVRVAFEADLSGKAGDALRSVIDTDKALNVNPSLKAILDPKGQSSYKNSSQVLSRLTQDFKLRQMQLYYVPGNLPTDGGLIIRLNAWEKDNATALSSPTLTELTAPVESLLQKYKPVATGGDTLFHLFSATPNTAVSPMAVTSLRAASLVKTCPSCTSLEQNAVVIFTPGHTSLAFLDKDGDKLVGYLKPQAQSFEAETSLKTLLKDVDNDLRMLPSDYWMLFEVLTPYVKEGEENAKTFVREAMTLAYQALGKRGLDIAPFKDIEATLQEDGVPDIKIKPYSLFALPE